MFVATIRAPLSRSAPRGTGCTVTVVGGRGSGADDDVEFIARVADSQVRRAVLGDDVKAAAADRHCVHTTRTAGKVSDAPVLRRLHPSSGRDIRNGQQARRRSVPRFRPGMFPLA